MKQFSLTVLNRTLLTNINWYRNFPQGTISDMVGDSSQGISFVCNNISAFGGDPNRCLKTLHFIFHRLLVIEPYIYISYCLCRIYLMGQSAGAHISSCALIEQAIKESKGESISWSVSQIKAYFGLSGG